MNEHEHKYEPTGDDGFLRGLRCACGMTPLDAACELPMRAGREPEPPSGEALMRYFHKITNGRVGRP
jgi:hypothetical protein